ncbi:hypothetical protein JL720_9500 [Aureococcus anophagefferens]|nr:hypothetical protein JL720_9500 [Aureococcus anophagefferens]
MGGGFDDRYAVAQLLIMQRNLPQAEVCLLEAMQSTFGALSLLSDLSAAMSMANRAAAFSQILSQLNPNDGETIFLHAQRLSQAGRWDESMRIVLPVLAVASAFVVPQRRLGARSTRRESPASSGTGPCSALGARIDRMRRHSSAFEGETERGDLEPVPKAAAKEARTLLNATWHYAWARRGEVTTRARRVARDCRDVAAEVTDYAAASAYLSRAHRRRELVGRRGPWASDPSAPRGLAARAIAGLYGVGFLMALRQNRALVGSRACRPATATLDRVATRQSTWRRRVEAAPTLLWFCYQGKELDAPKKRVSLDAGLDVVAASGLACGAALPLRRPAGGLARAGCYACYLSLATVGAPFYSYGWDSQLLETTALCLLRNRRSGSACSRFAGSASRSCSAGLIKLRARGARRTAGST